MNKDCIKYWFFGRLVIGILGRQGSGAQGRHSPDQLRAFDEAMNRWDRDLLFHGDAATEKMMGTKLSRTDGLRHVSSFA
jgi:hypothetical protein